MSNFKEDVGNPAPARFPERSVGDVAPSNPAYTAPVNLAAMLNLEGETALIVGGGAVALRRAQTLTAAGLRVRVVAPEVLPELAGLDVDVIRRGFESSDVRGVRLVVACTDSKTVNDEVIRLGREAGALVNHAGQAELGNLRFPAVLERGGVTLAISTGTELPMLAQALRERLESVLPAHLPLTAWTNQRQAALSLGGQQREMALGELRAEIRGAVGL